MKPFERRLAERDAERHRIREAGMRDVQPWPTGRNAPPKNGDNAQHDREERGR